MTSALIRPARADDHAALMPLFAELDAEHVVLEPREFQAFEGPPRTRAWLERVTSDPGQALLVAESEAGGALAGLVHALEQRREGAPMIIPHTYALVDNLVVAPAHRRRGLGRALMDAALAWGRARGLSRVKLKVWASNTAALEFYRALGFMDQVITLGIELEGRA